MCASYAAPCAMWRSAAVPMQSIVTQYLTTVKPMHEQFVEPTRKFADIVVLEGGNNLVALDLIMQRIAHHIAQS